MKHLTTLFILFLLFSCDRSHNILGIETARQQLKQALTDKTDNSTFVGNIINNQKTAVDIAEPILFKAYGKEEIIGEKPYEVYLIDKYWVLNGTMPEGMNGGTFLIILSAKDGRVIKLIHGK